MREHSLIPGMFHYIRHEHDLAFFSIECESFKKSHSRDSKLRLTGLFICVLLHNSLREEVDGPIQKFVI